MASTYLTNWGRESREALEAVLVQLKSSDLLSPVTVVTPSVYSGLSLRRVAAGLQLGEPGTRGVANVAFTTLSQLASRLGVAALAAQGLRPLTREVRAEAVRVALSRAIPADDPLSTLAQNPSTEQAFMQVITELRSAPDALVQHLSTMGVTARDTRRSLPAWSVEVYREFLEITKGYCDATDIAQSAVDRLVNDPACFREIGDVVLYAPRCVLPHEWALIKALAKSGRIHPVLAVTGDDVADAEIVRLASALSEFGLETVSASAATDFTNAPSLATRIITAPDAEEEVRLVMREVVRAAERGEHLYRKAIVFAVDDPYAQLISDLMYEADIPFSGVVTERLSQTAPGRVLAGAMRVAHSDLGRAEVISWINSGPVIFPVTGQPVPSRQWDYVSRNAGVISGADEWSRRLHAHISRRQEELRDPADELTDSRRRAREIEIKHAENLTAFIEAVAPFASVFERGRTGTWIEFISEAGKLLDTFTGGVATRATWPTDQQLKAYEQICDALDSLESLSNLRESITADVFHQALADLLDAPAPHERKFGDGVFVGRIADAVGADFESIYVLGAIEGVLPSRRRENPLISDQDRNRLFAETDGPHWPRALPTRDLSEAQARFDFRATLASAGRDRVICHPVGDLRSGRALTPSRWLIDDANTLRRTGNTILAGDFRGLTPLGDWHLRSPSLASQLASDDFTPAAEDEFELQQLLPMAGSGDALLDCSPVRADTSLWRGIASQVALTDSGACEYFGLVSEDDEFTPGPNRPVSPTSLQTWAECPYRYMLEKVLRLTVVEKPEAIEEISPLDRGTLIHQILDTFHRQNPSRTPDGTWTNQERSQLHKIAESVFVEWEARGVTGRSPLWEITKTRISRLLDGFLKADARLRKHFDIGTTESEVGFGFDSEDGLPAAMFQVAGREIAFRGRIDRLDVSADGKTTVIVDYKTGDPSDSVKRLHRVQLDGNHRLPESHELEGAGGGDRFGYTGSTPLGDPVGEGRLLQLPVYAVGSQTNVEQTFAFYWHLDLKLGSSTCFGYRIGEPLEARFDDVLNRIVEGVRSGIFPLNPGQPASVSQRSPAGVRGENCAFCQFDPICPADRFRISLRKSEAPEFVSYFTLAGVIDG